MKQLLALLIFSNIAFAIPESNISKVDVRLFIDQKVNATAFYQAYENAADQVYRQLQVALATKSEETITDPRNWTVLDFIKLESYHYFKKLYHKRKFKAITIVATNTLEGGYYAGWSSRNCDPYGFIIVHVGSDWQKIAVLLKHELGHLLGMDHFNLVRSDNSCFIMHENAGWCVGSDVKIPYHITSVRDKNRCFKKLSHKRFYRKYWKLFE